MKANECAKFSLPGRRMTGVESIPLELELRQASPDEISISCLHPENFMPHTQYGVSCQSSKAQRKLCPVMRTTAGHSANGNSSLTFASPDCRLPRVHSNRQK